MTMPFFADTETYSETDLKSHGTHRYAEDDSAEIMLFAYSLDENEPDVWDLTAGARMPSIVEDNLMDPSVLLVFQNSHFDRTLMRLAENFKLDIPVNRFHDTMVQAQTHSLPGGLDRIGQVLNLDHDQQKDKRGKQLIQLFCKPRPKNMKLRRATSDTHPQDWAEFIEYARQDIVPMRLAFQRLPKWNTSGFERRLWELDQRINDRGFAVDLDLAKAAVKAADRAKVDLKEQVSDATLGVVDSATQRDRLLAFILDAYGVDLPDLTADTLKRRVDDPELPEGVRQLIRIRLEASMSTSTKYQTLLRATSADGRLRNALQFAGAGRTQRWAGRLFQPQNMKRPDRDMKDPAWQETMIAATKADALDLIHNEPMRCLANMVRGCIIAAPFKKLVTADLSNIEGRKLVWLTGELWKLQAFRDIDAGIGEDMYKRSYGKAFNVAPESVDDFARQIGKVLELSMGYEGGVGAFVSFAAVYNVDLDELADAVWQVADMDEMRQVEGVWNWTVKKNKTTFGLDKRVWMACEYLKRAWRAAHPMTVQFWKDAREAVVRAITNPGVPFKAGQWITCQRDGAWLRVRLPSGRYLCYLNPVVEGNGITYSGVSPYTRQWVRISTHGGKLLENWDQASSRDVLAYGMVDAEAEGYDMVLTVHDEIIAETPDEPYYTSEGLAGFMARPRAWCPGLPLAAKGFEAYRYRKD